MPAVALISLRSGTGLGLSGEQKVFRSEGQPSGEVVGLEEQDSPSYPLSSRTDDPLLAQREAFCGLCFGSSQEALSCPQSFSVDIFEDIPVHAPDIMTDC